MPYLVLKKPGESAWVTYIKKRISLNKNFLSFVSGSTGNSKSYSCLSVGNEIDPDGFGKQDHRLERVVFTAEALMELINSGGLKKGSVIVFDEMGIAQSHLNWQSQTNKLLNYLMQSFRHRNLILLMNSPFMDFVDLSTRKLFHAEFSMQSIDYKKKEAIIKPQFLEYNARMRKFYYSRLFVMKRKTEGAMQLDLWRVPMPPKKLYQPYEIKKEAFTDKLNKSILDGLKMDRIKREEQVRKNLAPEIMICYDCEHNWNSSLNKTPKRCPKCRSYKIGKK